MPPPQLSWYIDEPRNKVNTSKTVRIIEINNSVHACCWGGIKFESGTHIVILETLKIVPNAIFTAHDTNVGRKGKCLSVSKETFIPKRYGKNIEHNGIL